MAGIIIRFASVVAAALATCPAPTGAWTPQGHNPPASESPGPRNGHRMANDRTRKEAVLFGGVGPGATAMGDTWVFGNGSWRRAATDGPAPRAWHSMAYLPQERVTILFGGRGADGRSLADTWAWDGTQWRELDVSGPPARDHHAQAFDPASRGILLFGGIQREVDLWRYLVISRWSVAAIRSQWSVTAGRTCHDSGCQRRPPVWRSRASKQDSGRHLEVGIGSLAAG